MERKYRKKSNLINSTGYTPGYASEKNPMNIIPSTDITMENTPYPVYGQPLDQFGNPIAAPTYMEPGYDYNYGDEASYVAEVPAYKDGGKKQAWISEKIGILMGEGRPQKQAIAIAYSMWNQKHEDGGYQLPEYQYAGAVNFGQKPNGFSFYNRPPDFGTTVGYDPKIDPSKYGFGTDSQLSENALTAGEDWKKNNPLPQGMFASNLSDDATKTTTADPAKTGANGIHQFYNPYGDIGMGDALYFGGQEFAKGNNWKGAAGVGLGLLKGTKDFLAGMGNQKRQDTIMKSYNENQRKNMTGENRAVGMKMGGYYQDGGEELTKAYIESGQYPEDSQNWYDNNPPMFILPSGNENVEEPTKKETTPTTTLPKPKKEVWQVWEEKTGKSWKEAKRLGYTDGSAKGNLKLLSELNDPRFKASNLRESSTKPKKEVSGKMSSDTINSYLNILPRSAEAIDAENKWYASLITDDMLREKDNKKGVKPPSFVKKAKPSVNKKIGRIQGQQPLLISEQSSRYNQPTFSMKQGYFQEGGEQDQMGGQMPMPQDQSAGQDAKIQQVMQQVAQMLQEGADPQQVVEQLIQSGIPEEQAIQMIQGVMQQMQSGQPQMKSGGEMIKRADGSYSKRGLWDNIRDNAGSGKKPTKQMLEQEAKIKSGYEYGGMHDMEEYAEGGTIPDRYKNDGFTKVGVKRQSTRPGKKWMVLAKKGDQYKVVHGGDNKMKDFSQHGSEDRKENFWNRMGGRDSAKANDPFSPLYWHKKFGTWQEGGEIEEEGEDEMMEGENPQQEQIEDQVEQALKQGADPQEVLQQLVQMGMPEEEAIQMIQEILQELQNGEEQEAPEEEEQPEMKNGGNYLEALKGKVIKNYTYNKNTGNYDVEFE